MLTMWFINRMLSKLFAWECAKKPTNGFGEGKKGRKKGDACW